MLAPVVRARKGEHVKEFEAARKGGFVRVRVDGILYDLSETIKLKKNNKHTIEIVVDRLVIKPGIHSRLADSIETAASLAGELWSSAHRRKIIPSVKTTLAQSTAQVSKS